MAFPSVAVLRFQIFQKLLPLLAALDVSLDKYAVHWAAQIGCPPSLVPFLLAPQHTPKPCLLDETIQVQRQPSSAVTLDGYVRNLITR